MIVNDFCLDQTKNVATKLLVCMIFRILAPTCLMVFCSPEQFADLTGQLCNDDIASVSRDDPAAISGNVMC